MKQLKTVVQDISSKQSQLFSQIQSLTQELLTIPGKITEKLRLFVELQKRIDNLDAVILDSSTRRLLDATLRTAEYNLLHWQYLVARSYEYRSMQPYPGQPILWQLRNRLIAALDEDRQNATRIILELFDNQLRNDLIDLAWKLEQTMGPGTTVSHLYLSSDHPVVEKLNEDHEAYMILEPFSDPGLSPYEEVQRISIDPNFPFDIKIHTDPFYHPFPSQDELTLVIEHREPSVVRYSGKLFGVTNAPFQWIVKKDLRNPQGGDGTEIMDKPVPSYESIIRYLLSYPGVDPKFLNITLWEEPAMWTTYFLNVQHTPAWLPLPKIINITISIPYNRITLSNKQQCMLRVDTVMDNPSHLSSKNLKQFSMHISMGSSTPDSYPLINVSPIDLNGRTSGYGPKFFRFFMCNNHFTLYAEAMSPTHEFLYWQVYQNGKETRVTQLELKLVSKDVTWAIAHYKPKTL